MGAVETRETGAGSIAEVTDSTTGAITSSLVTVAVKGVSARGTLLELTCRSTVSGVTEATNVLHSIPGSVVSAPSLDSQVLFRPARTAVVTVIGASRTLASNTIISGETLAGAGLAVARAFVGALHPGVEVVGVDDITDPGEIAGAGAKGAIWASPLVFTVQTSETLAVGVLFAGTVVGAVVLTQATVAVTALVPGHLPPALDGVRRCRGGSIHPRGIITSRKKCGTSRGVQIVTGNTSGRYLVSDETVMVHGADFVFTISTTGVC